jgi:hypothetical protein
MVTKTLVIVFPEVSGSNGLASVMEMDRVPVEDVSPPPLSPPPLPPQPMKTDISDINAKAAKDRPLNFISLLLACLFVFDELTPDQTYKDKPL